MTVAVYSCYAITDEAMLREGTAKLASYLGKRRGSTRRPTASVAPGNGSGREKPLVAELLEKAGGQEPD